LLRASVVSPLRLLRPVVSLSLLTGLLTFYVYAVLGPAANQAYREIIFALIVSRARNDVQPRVFNDDLIPGGTMVLYVSDVAAETGLWKDVFIHDTRNPQQPKVILARSGQLTIDKARKRVGLDLQHGVSYTFQPSQPGELAADNFETGYFPFAYEEFFPKLPLAKGDRELTMAELSLRVRELPARPWVCAANVVLGAAGVVLLVLNPREAAFDPLDARHYAALLPRIRTRPTKAPVSSPVRGRRGPRRVVVVRIPRLSWPIPGLIDRYIVRTYVG